MKIKAILYLIGILFLTACGSTNVHMSVMKPAPITVPQHIQTITIVNRTAPKNKVLNTLEGVLTGEGIGEDKQGAEEALVGLNNILSQTQRFEVKRATERYVGSGAGGVLPDPLAWNIVEALCKKYNTNAIIALESYDSDFIVTNSEKDVEVKNPDGTTVMQHKFYAEGLASVKMGYRLYDPINKTITDQDMFTRNRTWNGVGNSATDAVAHLINKNQAIKAISADAGYQYGQRIAPMYTTVSRGMYKKAKGNNAVAQGARLAEVKDWSGAIDAWEKAIKQGDTKSKGRAAYNLAVANEVLGYLHESKNWAQKAYAEYGEKQSKNYVRILDQRIVESAKVAEQMGVDPDW